MQTMGNWREYVTLIRKSKFYIVILHESNEVRQLTLHHTTELFKLIKRNTLH